MSFGCITSDITFISKLLDRRGVNNEKQRDKIVLLKNANMQ